MTARKRLSHEQFYHIVEYLRTQADENGVLTKDLTQLTRDVSALMESDVSKGSVEKAMRVAKLEPIALSGFVSAQEFANLRSDVAELNGKIKRLMDEFEIKEKDDEST